MKTYWCTWTYIANYGGPIGVEAKTPEDAANTLASWMSEDFQKKGRVYVFAEPPLVWRKPPGDVEPWLAGR